MLAELVEAARDYAWRKFGIGEPPASHQGRIPLDEVEAPKEADTVGMFDRTDWLGNPLRVGSYVVYPCESTGRGLERTTMQMTSGWVRALGEDSCVIEIDKRSRTGAPQGRQRRTVRLSAVGMASLTVNA